MQGGPDSIPDQGTRYQMQQLRPRAAKINKYKLKMKKVRHRIDTWSSSPVSGYRPKGEKAGL